MERRYALAPDCDQERRLSSVQPASGQRVSSVLPARARLQSAVAATVRSRLTPPHGAARATSWRSKSGSDHPRPHGSGVGTGTAVAAGQDDPLRQVVTGLFTPPRGSFVSPDLATPAHIYASKPRARADAEGNTSSKSRRPLQTITPLAAKLKLTPNIAFGKGDEAALVEHVGAKTGGVLISWRHEAICDIAQRLVASGPPQQPIPSKWPGDRFDVVWIFDAPASSGDRWSFTQVPQVLLAGDSDTVISQMNF
jgi:hypothetical protein